MRQPLPDRGRSNKTPRRVFCTSVLLAAALAALAGCASTSTRTETPPTDSDRPAVSDTAATGETLSDYPFGANSFWRTTLVNAPIRPDSSQMVDHLVASVVDRYGGIAAFNAHQYNSPLYTADASTPRVDVRFNDCQQKGYTPDGLFGPSGQFVDVPMPEDAVPAAGTDGELSVYAPSSDQVWEFWVAKKDAEGRWSACWGGRIDHASTGDGRFTGFFGATATGLPNAGGVVRLEEIKRGRIDHAISLAIPDPAVSTDFSWPAQRSDGVDPDPRAIPEGSRLRLDPAVDVTQLDLTPAGAIIARAAQKYGFVVVDRSGGVSVLAEAVTEEGGGDPWAQLLGIPDGRVLDNFPWDKIEVIEKDYGRPAG